MKKIVLALLFSLGIALPAWSTEYFVDPGCDVAGDGTSSSCLSPATHNPKKTIATGLALLANPDDILTIRGGHDAHDSHCVGTTGVYDLTTPMNQGSIITVSSLHGTSGHDIIIQGAAADAPVFLDGVNGADTWTQCTGSTGSCSTTGGCNLLNSGNIPCNEVWYTTNTEGGFFAKRATGDPTYRVAGPWDMTNNHPLYDGRVCSVTSWLRCQRDEMCPTGEQCNVTHAEIDSAGNNTSHSGVVSYTTWVRWGTGGPPTGSHVVYGTNYKGGSGLWVDSSARFITLKHFTLRNFAAGSIVVEDTVAASAPHDITFDDVHSYYSTGIGGPDYAMHITGTSSAGPDVTNITVQNSTLAYSGSEGIHSDPNVFNDPGETGGVMTLTFSNVDFYGAGSSAVLSDHIIHQQTPHCGIFGNGSSTTGIPGHSPLYNVTVNNSTCHDITAWQALSNGATICTNTPFFACQACSSSQGLRCRTASDCPSGDTCSYISEYAQKGPGFSFENGHVGPSTISNTVFNRIPGYAISSSTNAPEGGQHINIYNNAFLNTVTDPTSDGCTVWFAGSSGGPFSDVNIYNNVFAQDTYSHPFFCNQNTTAAAPSIRLSNNIFLAPPGGDLLSWSYPSSSLTANNNAFAFFDSLTAGAFHPCTVNGTISTPRRLGTVGGVTVQCPNPASPTRITTLGSNNVYLDPQVTSLATHDFRTTSISPLLDAGTSGVETGYPSGRTAGMNNSLALTAMCDTFPARMDEGAAKTGASWEIGPFESRVPYPGMETSGSVDFLDVNTGWGTQAEGGCSVLGTCPSSAVASGTCAGTTDVSPRSGGGMLRLRGRAVGPTCGSFNYTMSNLNTSRTYTISGWFQEAGDVAANDEKLSIQVDGVTKCSILPTGDVTSWTAFPDANNLTITGTCTFTPGAATAVLTILKEEQAAGDTSYWVDDINVQVTN